MKQNENTCIVGRAVILVPYKEYHVPKYHNWMKSEELQQQTASEPLSLEEEYEMQKSWHLDDNKCTYIVLDKEKYDETNDEIGAMIGDTNLFFTVDNQHEAEAEIMIAEECFRGKKRGWEAMLLMLRYGVDVLNIFNYEVKIKMDNHASIKMFSKMGFSEISRSEVFSECTMQKSISDDWIRWLHKETSAYKIVDYDELTNIQ